MISIQQDSRTSELNSLLVKYGQVNLEFNTKSIEEDIERLTNDLNNSTSKKMIGKAIWQRNIENINKYLEGILKRANNGEIKVNWTLDKGVVRSYPIEIRNIPEYRIQVTDYINIKDGQMIYLDYSKLANIIAFEIMFRDLDDTNKSMEEYLKDVGIATVTSADILHEKLKENPYKLSKMLLISDSPYLSNNGMIKDYFGMTEFKADSYREVVEHSCRVAIAIILEKLLKKQSVGLKFEVCGVFETGIYLWTDSILNKYSREDLTEAICIRTFGRKFEVSPEMIIY